MSGRSCNPRRTIIVTKTMLNDYGQGGLVIKDALCKSHEYKSSGRNSRAAAVIDFTYGIAFLGTPHRGGNHTAWAKIATNFANVVLKDHNARIIDALKTGSEILERLQDSFCGIVKQVSIFSFLEDIAYGSAGKIVDDDSATLGLPCERKQWIPANHSDMCKFKSETDHGYERVSGGIIDLVEDAVAAVGKKEAEKDTWVNVDQNGQPIDMTSDMMKMAFGPFNKALKNPDEVGYSPSLLLQLAHIWNAHSGLTNRIGESKPKPETTLWTSRTRRRSAISRFSSIDASSLSLKPEPAKLYCRHVCRAVGLRRRSTFFK